MQETEWWFEHVGSLSQDHFLLQRLQLYSCLEEMAGADLELDGWVFVHAVRRPAQRDSIARVVLSFAQRVREGMTQKQLLEVVAQVSQPSVTSSAHGFFAALAAVLDGESEVRLLLQHSSGGALGLRAICDLARHAITLYGAFRCALPGGMWCGIPPAVEAEVRAALEG